MKVIILVLLVAIFNFDKSVSALVDVNFCVINEFEYAKCDTLSTAVIEVVNNTIKKEFTISCSLGNGVFDCMKKIDSGEADILNLDVGTAFYAVQNFGIRPIAVESYNLAQEPLQMKLKYTSNAVVAKGSVKTPEDLKGASACFPGVGSAEGWAYPLSKLISKGWLRIENCNSDVKNSNAFFSNGSCAPESTDPTFNVLGDNGQKSCELCQRKSDNRRFCSTLDPYAGNAGALKCLEAATNASQKAVAFVRGDIIERMIKRGELNGDNFELLCPDSVNSSYTMPLSAIEECNWGTPMSRMLVAKLTSSKIPRFKDLFRELINNFGPNGSNIASFSLFDSSAHYNISNELKLLLGKSGDLSPPQQPFDLMFSDTAMNIYFPLESQIRNYFSYAAEYLPVINTLSSCPMPGVKWCVIDDPEMEKCASMKLALDIRQIQPQFSCVQGGSTTECMRLIRDGFADLMTLDAAEVYVAGKFLNLVPIAIEFYGDGTSYHAVAIVHRANKGILISNWKYKRTCHSGSGKATGWVVPINIALETVQFRVYGNKLAQGYGELVSRACVPGILNQAYNGLNQNPLNLCELCSGGGKDRCAPDSRENYYGDAGAFRCLLENGDIAFARHTTVHDNTDGRNPVYWARNRRSDDYELLCTDGSRVDTYSYNKCNLATIPGNMVVTGSYKTKEQREAMWRMLRYAQEYYSSDNNLVFQMFASPFGRSDLMFSDSTVILKPIPYENQTYTNVLDRTFMREVENLELIGKMKYSGLFNHSNKLQIIIYSPLPFLFFIYYLTALFY